MAIRLLNKNEVAKAQSEDRAREINEGLKISRRVDSLRDLMAAEEQSLEKFRSESLSGITAQISTLVTQKEAISREVDDLRKEKVVGMRGVEEEKRKVLLLKEDIETREESLKQKSFEIQKLQSDVQALIIGSEDELKRARTRAQDAEALHEEAFHAKEEAARALTLARETSEKIFVSRNESEQKILVRWQEVEIKEKELSEREADVLLAREKAQSETARLASIEETLDVRDRALVIRLQELEYQKNETARNLEDSRKELERVRTHKEEALRLHAIADHVREEAEKTLVAAKDVERDALSAKKAKEKVLAEREEAIILREEALAFKEEENERISEEITQKVVQLADQKKTLERAIGRVTK